MVKWWSFDGARRQCRTGCITVGGGAGRRGRRRGDRTSTNGKAERIASISGAFRIGRHGGGDRRNMHPVDLLKLDGGGFGPEVANRLQELFPRIWEADLRETSLVEGISLLVPGCP